MEDNPSERKVKEKIKRKKRVSSLLEESALPTKDSSIIQSDDIPIKVAKVTSNKQVKLSHANNGQIRAKLNPAVQALSNGTLPDDFYLLLMSVIGIHECLISNRRVCLLWNELVLERCHNQKSLMVFETYDNLMEYSELLLEFEKTEDTSLSLKSIGDDLIFEKLETDHEQLVNSLGQENDDIEDGEGVEDVENDVQQVLIRKNKLNASKILTSLFPKVEQLVLCPEYDTFINIEHILQFYAKQLTSLTITRFGSKLQDFSFPMLKSLHAFYLSDEDHILSLLPQLESLTLKLPFNYFGSDNISNISLEILLRTGTQLHELNTKNIQSVYTATGNQFSKRLPINNNLRKFSFDNIKNVSQAIEFISLNLTSLEFLKLNFSLDRDNIHHLNSLISHLVPLHQLHSLTLQASVSYFLLNDNQLAEIQPLQSVRHLKLFLFGYASLSMELFSRAIFTAFPKVEQVLIAFVGNIYKDGLVDTATFAAFEEFAGKHPNVVKLIRSKDMSKLTNLPNYVSPLLGHRRQMYEEYIEFEELFGVPLCKLAGSLGKQELGDRLNLKNTLRPANRLAAMSNLLQLLQRPLFGAFEFTYDIAYSMLAHMAKCALKYGPSEGQLFMVTCQCILNLLNCNLVDDEDEYYYDMPPSILYRRDMSLSPIFEKIRKLFEHYETLKFNDKYLLFQLSDCLIMILKQEKSTFIRPYEDHDKNDLFKILLKMADYYKARKLRNYDYEELLPKIHELMDDILKKFDKDSLDKVISEFIRSDNRVYRMEMTMALNRCCKSKDNCFK